MNMKIPLSVLFALTLLVLPVSALLGGTPEAGRGQIRFKAGWIESCSILHRVPEFMAAQAAASTDAGSAEFAVIKVRLDPGRSLSVYDYVLEDTGGFEHACSAVYREGSRWDRAQAEIAATDNNLPCRLVFDIKLHKKEADLRQFRLKFKLFQGFKPVVLDFADDGAPPAAVADAPNKNNIATPDQIKAQNDALLAAAVTRKAAESADLAGKININTATREQLLSLNGIGEKTVDRIIQGRPYQSVEDLLKIKGVRRSNFDKFVNMLAAN
jgi:hypothetical protein